MKVLGVDVPSPGQLVPRQVLEALPGPFSPQRDLTGTVVAITGGAQGIGKEVARALIAAGCRVAIGDLDVELARATAAELGPECAAFPLDVTKRDVFTQFLDDAEDALGPLDVLVNNAGIMIVGAFGKETDHLTDLQIDINVKGVLNGCKLVLPRMRDRGTGHLVNIASAAGKAAIPNLVTYVGTKHAVVGLSDALRVELRGTGIDVSVVMPNAVNTDLGKGLADSMIPKVEPEDVADAVVRLIRTRKPEATVPRYLGAISAPMAMLPVSVRERLTGILGGHRVMLDADTAAREEYEERASRSVS